MGKAKQVMRTAARAGMAWMAAEGLASAAMLGATRYAGRRMRERGTNRAVRATGHALMLATAALPVLGMVRRRFM